MTTTRISCDLIEATAATQVRVKLDKGYIDQYTKDIKNGAIMPAVDVFKEEGSGRYILSRGFHRLIAHIHAEVPDIECEVHKGGMREALAHAFGGNAEHGLRRTSADKRHAVEMALKDPYFSQLPRQEVADMCRVTVRTVQKIANLLFADSNNGNDRNNSDGNNGNQSQDPSDSDVRPTAPEPTQAEIERDELRGACKVFAAFPYDGPGAVKLKLDEDDIKMLEYVSTWCAGAVIALR